MAFFGVSSNLINCGTPSASQQSESSGMTPYQAVLVAREVRLRGVAAAQQSFAQLQYEYGNAYAAYQKLQAEVSTKAAEVEAYFEGADAAARAVCEKAAQAKVVQIQEGGNDHTHPRYLSLVAGLGPDRRKAVDQMLVPYFSLLSDLEAAENALWVKHMSLEAVQQVHALWSLELNAADWQLQTMPADEGKSVDRNLAELRHVAQRVAEIRKKRLLKRKKEKTVSRHRAGGASDDQQRTPQRDSNFLVVEETGAPRSASSPPRAGRSSPSSRRSPNKNFDASNWL